MKAGWRSFSRSGQKTYLDGVERASQIRRTQADAWAKSPAPVVKEILALGYSGMHDLARELETRGCATRRGGKWSTDLTRKLCRRLVKLGIIQHPKLQGRYHPSQPSITSREGVDRGRRALRDNADDFARSIAPILSSLRAHGFTTNALLADALNARAITPQRAKCWTKANVRHLCNRLREMKVRDSGDDNFARWLPEN